MVFKYIFINLTYTKRVIKTVKELSFLYLNPARVNRTPDQLIYSQPLYQLSYHRLT